MIIPGSPGAGDHLDVRRSRLAYMIIEGRQGSDRTHGTAALAIPRDGIRDGSSGVPTTRTGRPKTCWAPVRSGSARFRGLPGRGRAEPIPGLSRPTTASPPRTLFASGVTPRQGADLGTE